MKYDVTIVLAAGIFAMIYAFWKTNWIESQDQGNSKMKSIGSSIAEGAMSFLKAEYRVLAIFDFVISH
jgi:K(+)-stimulated pyrophosphate-energized sodium pump